MVTGVFPPSAVAAITWGATICSACWSICPHGCSLFPWTGGTGPCEPGGCSRSPGGGGRSGGEAASPRSLEASGYGPGNRFRRRRGARGERARSWRSAAGRRSCVARRWSCGGGAESWSGCRCPSLSPRAGPRSGGGGGSHGSHASAEQGKSGGLSHWCCRLGCGNA